MQIYSNNTPNLNFQGATRTLKRNYLSTAQEIIDLFEKYPKSDGIAGNLPYSWVKDIVHLPKAEKTPIFKGLYKLFRESFSAQSSSQPSEISRNFTTFLHKHKIIPPENQIIVKERNFDGKVLKRAYTISERGAKKTLEPLFVKQFIDNTGKRFANKEGVLPELALGLHLGKVIGNERILSPYFGDTMAKFMVSKYEVTPQNVKIPRKLSKFEAFDDEKIQDYFSKLKKITGDNSDIQMILSRKDFTHEDLHDENILITRNKKGHLIVKCIDLGRISHQLLKLFG